MSEVPVWTCEFSEIEGQPKLDHLTVGDHFRLQCKGDIAVAWTADVPVVRPDKPERDYALHILSAEQLNPQSVQMTVTGYRPGDHKPEYLRVMQGPRGFEFEKPTWKIDSVIATDGPPPQPFPSYGPFHLEAPGWLAVTLYVTLALIVSLIGLKLYRWSKRRSFRRELEQLRTALAPIRQFYRDSRALRRRLAVSTNPAEVRAVGVDLNRDFRLMLTREFEVPAQTWSDAAIAKYLIRRRPALMSVAGDDIRKTLRELTRAQSREVSLDADVDQLLRMAVDAAEKIERGGK